MGTKQPNGIQDILPLTPLQEGLLFESGVHDGPDAYVGQVVLTIEGELSVADLRDAGNQLLRRHPNLRASFRHRKNGAPVALVPRLAELPWQQHDLTGSSPGDVQRVIDECKVTRFDVAKSPLIRFTLLKVAEQRHQLVVTNHHLILDGWSTTTLARELFDLYCKRTPRPVRPYRDYLAWLTKQDRAVAAATWREALNGITEPTRLTPDWQRERAGTAANVYRDVSREITAALTSLARTEGLTLNTVVQGAWALLLSRLTGRQDVVFGQTVSGRPPEINGIESMIGLFITTVPVRVQLQPAETLVELLVRVRDEQATVMPFQHLGLQAIQRVAGIGELFDTLLVFENYPVDPNTEVAPGLTLVDVDGEEGTHYPLSLTVLADETMTLDFGYSTTVFTAERIREVGDRFVRLLETIARDPHRHVGTVGVLGDEERASLLARETAETPDGTLVDVFAAQVAITPDSTALVLDGRSLTFAELDRASSTLAHRLAGRGVGPEKIVLLALPRVEFVIGLLAVWKAGGAYVPVDPDHPAEGFAQIVADTAAVCAVSTRAIARRLTIDTVMIDEPAPEHVPAELLPGAPGNAAYVIYTSGSTGRPKGVVVDHAALANFHTDRPRLMAPVVEAVGDRPVRVAHAASFAFDGSWGPLSWLFSGGEVHVLDEDTRRDPEALAHYIDEHGIDFVDLTPAAIGQLVEQGMLDGEHRPSGIVVGGEGVADALWQRLCASGASVLDRYGPTECTVDSYGWQGSDRRGSSNVNSAEYVLDASLQLVAPGVAGELYLAGAQLARGYLNQPAMTADRFVANPFGDPGERMYRTGDLARRRPDRTLEILGRIDDQVKIRGYRIEPREISAVLESHSAVTRAAVVVREKRRLVAYVTPADVDTTVLRAYAATSLPEYLLPSALVAIDALPLTPNGKLDVTALPAPSVTSRVAPRTPREHLLSMAFAEVLGLGEVGADADFFELGGDSIVSIQLVVAARTKGLAITARDIFQNRTVAALAAVAKPIESASATPVVSGVGRVPLTPIMHGLLELGGPIDQLAQTMLIPAPASLTEASLKAAVSTLLERHHILRARLADRCLEVPEKLAVQVDRLVSVVEGDAVAAESERAAARLRPRAGVMLQVVWLKGGPTTSGRLLLVAHHLVVDGVSWRIIVPELTAAIEGRALPAVVSTPFRQWAQLLTERAAHADSLAKWLDILADPEPLIGSRPLDPKLDTSATARTITRTLPSDVTAPLLTSVPSRFHGNVNDVLLTGLALAFAKWRGHPSVLLDLEGHGREEEFVGADVDLSQTVGWFTAQFPVRLDVGALTGGRALKRVKEQLRAVPDNGVSYGVLRYLNPDVGPELARLSTPQVMFNYLGRFGADEVLDDAADQDLPSSHPLGINAITRDTQSGPVLDAQWSWAEGILTEAEVEELARLWFEALETLTSARGGLTPSDVPLVALSQEQIEGIEDADVVDILPLTPLQEGLLFQSLAAGDDVDVYVLQGVVELDGPLDVPALKASAEALLERHPNLRARFVHVGLAQPVQVIPAHSTLPWRVVDSVDDLIESDFRRGFDLTESPLLRFTLQRLEPQRHRLIVTAHHIVLDGWSMPLLGEELFALYQRGTSALPAAPNYRDYLTWLCRQDKASALASWKSALAGLDGPTSLAPHQVRNGSTTRPEYETLLSAQLTADLEAVAKRLGVTVNTIIQTAWALVVSRLTGQQDVVFGQIVSGRPPEIPHIDAMIGLFINALPVRVTVRPHETLGDLVRRVQHEQAQLLDSQHVGLADIQREAGLTRLFDTLVVFENYPDAGIDDEIAGLRITPAESIDATHYPLTVAVMPGERLGITLEYHPDCFDLAQTARIASLLVAALSAMGDSDRPVARIDVLPSAERRVSSGPQIPIEFDTAAEIFVAQAACTPNAPALRCHDHSFTFAELDAASNRLAHLLISHGAGPEQIIALQLPRTSHMIVAMLAVLKSGAAYLPIDPDYPQERIDLMLEDAEPLLVLDSIGDLSGWPASAPDVVVSPQHPAYVIYTSGSTGRPKGVVVSHQSLVNLFHSHRAKLYQPTIAAAGGRKLRVGHTWSFAFDASWQPQLWMLDGHELHVLDAMMLRDPDGLVCYLRRERLDFIEVSPSLAMALFEAGLGNACPLLAFGVGGEAVPPSFWQTMANLPNTECYNLYGPTETTVDALGARVRNSAEPRVGEPTANTHAVVLDAQLRPVPTGVVGELYLGGAGLARGYLRQYSLTASRFVADPFGPPGARLYRTGDVVRMTEDGHLEHLGRSDDQLKVRGFRIEPGEITAALERHDAVSRAVIVANGGRLVAYVVVREELSMHALRDYAIGMLPNHMVPSLFVEVPAIPLTAHGKVDVAALPAPDLAVLNTGRVPVTAVESLLCEIFAEVLGVSAVFADDDFFALGGHSLLLIRLRGRIESAVGCELPIAELMTRPTVEALATYVEKPGSLVRQ